MFGGYQNSLYICTRFQSEPLREQASPSSKRIGRDWGWNASHLKRRAEVRTGCRANLWGVGQQRGLFNVQPVPRHSWRTTADTERATQIVWATPKMSRTSTENLAARLLSDYQSQLKQLNIFGLEQRQTPAPIAALKNRENGDYRQPTLQR